MIAEVIVDVQNSEVDKIFDYKIPENNNQSLQDINIDNIEEEIKLGDEKNPLLNCCSKNSTIVLEESNKQNISKYGDYEKGMRVVVPFGKRIVEGFIINIKTSSNIEESKLKSIIKPMDKFAVIIPELLELMKFMVNRYNIKMVDALRLYIPSEYRKGNVKPLFKKYCFINNEIDLKNYEKNIRKGSKQQQLLIEYLQFEKNQDKNCSKSFEQAFLNKKFSPSAVNKFIKDNVLIIENIECQRKPLQMQLTTKNYTHTPEQERAIKRLSSFEAKTFVLHGVTGSGKTEVYMTMIEKVIKLGKTAIVLVPEISLTPQVLSNFRARLGENVAILHSGLSSGERYDEWRKILNGEAKVVVGARSAIFAPIKNIGLIVIDEEHETSYNSESNPRYKTHEVAKFRATYNNCSLILGSATPSISTYFSVMIGESELLELPTRTNQKEMPQIQIVDMLSEIRAGNSSIFSRQLINDLNECLSNNKQAILFLNRRGFTSFMRCNECGYIAKCTDCDVSLVYHKVENKLKCHYCGKRFKALTICPNCKSPYIRQGAVGTQKVVEEIQRFFPQIKVFRMDNDTTKNKNGHQKILEGFAKTKPSILVGTQMIAKGHDFDSVSLVGIIDADQSLYQSDYKSCEKTFQLITQVSGRAGRKEGGGKIVLQTYNPRHYVYKFVANYNYKGFYNKEINIREITKFPPFTTIVRILITHENEKLVLDTTKEIYEKLCEIERKYHYDFYFFDVMKSPHSKIKNKIRYQVLMRFTKSKECDIIKDIYGIINSFKNLKPSVFVEIDPQNLA